MLFAIGPQSLGDFRLNPSDLVCGAFAPAVTFFRYCHHFVALTVGARINPNHALCDQPVNRLLCGLTGKPHLSMNDREFNRAPAQLGKDLHICGPYRGKLRLCPHIIHARVPMGDQSHHHAFDILTQKVIVAFINHG